MKIIETDLQGCLILEPRVFHDDRGFFFETFNEDVFGPLGLPTRFTQGNASKSCRGTLRGLHYQFQRPQGKLVTVLSGEVYDVAVDIRPDSPQFGKSTSVILSAENKRQFWIPEGFAHGFLALTDDTVFTYLCTDTYQPQFDTNLLWNDPDLQIDWPMKDVLLSPKDAIAPRLSEIPADRLPAALGAQ